MKKPRKIKTLYHQNLRKRSIPFKESNHQDLPKPQDEQQDSKSFWRLKIKQDMKLLNKSLYKTLGKGLTDLFDYIFGK